MTEGWGKTKGAKSPTTLDQWMWPTHPEGKEEEEDDPTPLDQWTRPTPVHHQLTLPSFVWIRTEQDWPAFQRKVRSRVKDELAQFKEDAEAHFKASPLQRIKWKHSYLPMRILIRRQIQEWSRPEVIDEFWSDELEELEEEDRRKRFTSLKRQVSNHVKGVAEQLGIKNRTE